MRTVCRVQRYVRVDLNSLPSDIGPDVKPKTSLIICTTPRSGSGLLCELLWKSEYAGQPNEWFSRGVVARDSKLWGTKTDRAYVERVLNEGTTPNGVFGLKLHWSHWERLRQMVSDFPRPIRGGRLDYLGGVFPDIRYVWLTRRDKVRQAVSRFRQRQTGITKWGDKRKRSGVLDFDFEAIDGGVRELTAMDRGWASYFEHFGRPFVVVYEDDLEYGHGDTLHRLSSELGWSIPPADENRVQRRKLSDDLSESWVQLYKQEAGLP